MSSFTDNFAKTFQLGMGVANYRDNKKQQEFANELALRDDQRRDISLSREGDRHKQSLAIGEQNLTLNQQNIDFNEAVNPLKLEQQRHITESARINVGISNNNLRLTNAQATSAELTLGAKIKHDVFDKEAASLAATAGANIAEANTRQMTHELAGERLTYLKGVGAFTDQNTREASRLALEPVYRAFGNTDGTLDVEAALNDPMGIQGLVGYANSIAGHLGIEGRTAISATRTEDGKGIVLTMNNGRTTGPMTVNGTSPGDEGADEDEVVVIPLEEFAAYANAGLRGTGITETAAERKAFEEGRNQSDFGQNLSHAHDRETEKQETFRSAIETISPKLEESRIKLSELEPEYQRIMEQRTALEQRLAELEDIRSDNSTDRVLGADGSGSGLGLSTGGERTSLRREINQIRAQLRAFDRNGNNRGIISRYNATNDRVNSLEGELSANEQNLNESIEERQRITENQEALIRLSDANAVLHGNTSALAALATPKDSRTPTERKAASDAVKDSFNSVAAALYGKDVKTAHIPGLRSSLMEAVRQAGGQQFLAKYGISPYVLTNPEFAEPRDLNALNAALHKTFHYNHKDGRFEVRPDRGDGVDPEAAVYN